MSARPICYMDIDGVLNVFASRTLEPIRFGPKGTGGLWIDPNHGAVIARLAEQFEMRWATMWQSAAPSYFASIAGYGRDWPYVDFDAMPGDVTHGIIGYKMRALLHDAGRRPFVWFDDDFTAENSRIAAHRSRTVAHTEFVAVDPRYGLTASDAAAVATRFDILVGGELTGAH